jgi:hypothetical protein
MDNKANSNGLLIFELLRLFTPVGITISLFILTSLNNKLESMDAKIFKHLTNDEIHIPRGQVVSKGEYDLFCKNYDKDSERIYIELRNIRVILEEERKSHERER